MDSPHQPETPAEVAIANNLAAGPTASKPARTYACTLCNRRKVKCDLGVKGSPCTNCWQSNAPCKRRDRKRKRFNITPSPPPQEASNLSPRPVPATTNSPGSQRQHVSVNQTSLLMGRGTTHDNGNHSIPTPASHDPNNQILGPEQSYLGRSEYLADVPSLETGGEPHGTNATLSPVDMEVLRLHKAFELPTKSIQSSLTDNFMTYCAPWTPIVERSWLETSADNTMSYLLLQSVFLAGSRVSSGRLLEASSREFYSRAKALFYTGYEKSTMVTIIATVLLHWWNPTGPEKISSDTSQFWLRMSVGFAYQMGLHKDLVSGKVGMIRRRVWWSLVARDSMISAALGRPRNICLKDSDVRPLSIEDFPSPSVQAQLFVAYVKVCQIMGDVTECRLRKQLHQDRRSDFANALCRWVKELPSELRLFQVEWNGHRSTKTLSPYNFEARQLLVHYFVTLIVLNRPSVPDAPPSAISIVAGSFVCGIFESFLARDQVRYLRPNFAFLALAAGLSQLSCYRYPSLRSTAEQELEIVNLSLQDLAKKWPSADGALKTIAEANLFVLNQVALGDLPSTVPGDATIFFEDFGPDLCRHWHTFFGVGSDAMDNPGPLMEHSQSAPDFGPPHSMSGYGMVDNVGIMNTDADPSLGFSISDLDYIPDNSHQDQSTMPWFSWGPTMGGWLLHD